MSEVVRFPPEAVGFACSRCGARQLATLRTIFDTREPGAREEVLGGRFHLAVCTQCGTTTRVPTPFLFHDAGSESAFVLVPGLGAPRDAEEKAIGRLTNRLLESVAPTERRMYLLSPRSYVADTSFIEAVLATTGITPAMMEAARGRTRLVEQLLRANDPGARAELLDASGEDPRNVAAVAAAMGEQARSQNDTYRAEALERLARALAVESDRPPTAEELTAALEEARTEGALDEATAALRPFLDYAFFTQLTAAMDAAAAPDAARLRGLRSDVLAAIDRVEAAAEAEVHGAVATLRAALEAEDPVGVLRARHEDLTPTFFMVLAANVEAAREHGAPQVETRLEELHDAALEIVEAALPPRQRLANRLARSATDADRSLLLTNAAHVVDAAFSADLRASAGNARSAGALEFADNLEAAADLLDNQLALVGVSP